MKKMKKLITAIVAVGVLGSAGAVYAATIKTPAEITAELTGKTVDAVVGERAAGETYGSIAADAGKLEEFKAQMLEQKKAVLDQKVKDGALTQQQADEIYNAIKENQAACDGSGSARIGQKFGAGFGSGSCNGLGAGQGAGRGMGSGAGRGMGRGAGFGNGACRN